MKELLFIGKLNPQTQNLHSYLTKYFHVQLCSDNPEIAKSILKMCHPDIIVINMLDMSKIHTLIFSEIKNFYSSVPVVCFGTESELDLVADYLSSIQFQTVDFPVEPLDLLTKCSQRLNITITEILEEKEDVEKKEGWRRTLLFIDDDAQQLRTMRKLLSNRYNVQVATSGAEGIAVIGRAMPDMIFLDYDMPICDGKQTLEMIRNLEGAENIPVVFLTGVSDRDHIEAVLSLKPAGYLLKPAEIIRITQLVRQILGDG